MEKKLVQIPDKGIYEIICAIGHVQTLIDITSEESIRMWNDFLKKKGLCITGHMSRRFYATER